MHTPNLGFTRKKSRRGPLSRAAGRWFETLEDRRLLNGFVADINFAPANAPVPMGYVADSGLDYGVRTDGLTYGWNGTHKAAVVARHPKKPSDGVDNLEDTFATIHPKGTGSEWQIAVPDGNYQVSITAGDPSQTSGQYALDVNGASFMTGKMKPRAGRWVTASNEITVTNGLLTLTVPPGKLAKIDDIDISQIVPSGGVTPTPPVTTAEAPFTGSPFGVTQAIPFAQYDVGGQDVSYNYPAPANPGDDAYRAPDPVGINTGGTTGNVIADTVAGEWLNYTVDVTAAGAYTLSAWVSNTAAGGSFHASLDGQNITGAMNVPDTGDPTVFTTVISPSFNLAAGTQTISIYIDQAASNGTAGSFDTFELVAVPPVTPPPVTQGDTPFNSTPFSSSQAIPFAQYDDGGQGVSFNTSDTTNPGNDAYRAPDPVGINTSGTTGNVIADTVAGEWLNYTVDIPAAGSYTFSTSVSNAAVGGSFHVVLGGANVTGAVTVPNTGDPTVFATVTAPAFTLAAGTQTFSVYFDQPATNGTVGNFDTFEIAPYVPPVTPPPVTPTDTPFNASPFTVSQQIPFAQYDDGGQGVAFNVSTTTNPGNSAYRSPDPVGISTGGSTGNVISDTTAGEWLNYTVDVPTAGSYEIQASVANIQTGGTFHAEVSGTNLTGSIGVPVTSGWTTYATTTSSSFNLSAGVQIIHVVLDTTAANGAVGNFDTFEIIPTPPVTTTPTSLGTLSWTKLANVPVPTIEGGSIGVNGKLYVFGGFYDIGDGQEGEEDDGVWRGTPTCQVFNPATNTWSYIAPMPDAETHQEVATDGTYIYVGGGNLYNPATTYQAFATTEVWRYDIAANTWSAYTPLPEARGAGSMVLVGNELHFFGGVDVNRTPQTTHWELDITAANPQWTLDTPAPVSRNHVATFSLNGIIYMMGGRAEGTDTGLPSNTAYSFNPATATWTQLANLPNDWAVAAYAVVNGYCVIMGGSNDAADPITSVIAYNPATNTWSTLTSYPTPKIGPNGGLVGNELIISGGDDNGPQDSTYGAFIDPGS
jgi:N-acetylneuraminic acid mutarotase